MIIQYLKNDKETLRNCSLTTHTFHHLALPLLRRHLTVNYFDRLKECVRLMKRGAFRYARSLDLGVNSRRAILKVHWKDFLAVLGEFARYRSLNCLWFSEVPFNFAQHNQKNILETITALGSTVTELGLYGSRFSSYEDMISLIRSFPLCEFLFVRDCVTAKRAAKGNMFAGLPGHKLKLKDLQLSSSSPND